MIFSTNCQELLIQISGLVQSVHLREGSKETQGTKDLDYYWARYSGASFIDVLHPNLTDSNDERQAAMSDE